MVGTFERLHVASSLVRDVAHHEREAACLDEDQCGQRSRYSSIAVLKWMDLCESMMEPRRLHFRRDVVMAFHS